MYIVDYKRVPICHDYQIPFIHTRRTIKTSETLIAEVKIYQLDIGACTTL